MKTSQMKTIQLKANKKKKVLSMLLALTMIFQVSIPAVFAENEENQKRIVAFEELADDVKNITVEVDSTEEEVVAKMPSSLKATYQETTTGSAIEITIEDVTWELDEANSDQSIFDSKSTGVLFYYEPILPEGYTFVDCITLPQIQVKIENCDKLVFSQSINIDGVEITVKAEKDVFPEGAVLHAEKVTNIEDKEKIEDTVSREVKATNTAKTVKQIHSFDITITDADGNELQPHKSKGEVKVSFAKLSMIENEITKEERDIKVFHMNDTLSNAEEIESIVNDKGVVELVAEHFSVYAITETINTPDTDTMTTLYINKGNITIGDGTVSGFDASGTEITTANSNGYIITQENIDSSVNKYTIEVTSGTHNIVLKDASLYLNPDITKSPISISSGAKVNLVLEGSNYLRARCDLAPAGLHVPEGAELVIAKGSTGSISAFGGPGAGIGGNVNEAGGTITINGGTLDYVSGSTSGAGIGGGRGGAGGIITINGGTLKDVRGSNGAGIGGGAEGGAGGIITINGGTINTQSTMYGAGIGGGEYGGGGSIAINGGTVNTMGNYGSGIGGGSSGDGGIITISNGELTATSKAGAGIGGGAYGFNHTGGTITISGGTVTATSTDSNGVGIGNGFRGGSGDNSGGSLSSGGNFVYVTANSVNADTYSFKGIINNNGNTTVYGTYTLTEDTTIAVDKKMTISNGGSLIVPREKTLTVNGTLINNGILSLGAESCLTGTANTLSGDGTFKTMGDPTGDMILVSSNLIYNGTDLTETAKSAISIDTTKISTATILNHEFQVEANSSDGWILSINPEVVKETGTYTATFTNNSKTITSTFSVTAAEASGSVSIASIDMNSNSKLDIGDRVTADISGATPAGGTASYQWKKTAGGTTVSIGTNQADYTLTSSDIKGKIFCEVTFTGNTIGTISSNKLDIAKETLTGTITIAGKNEVGSILMISLPTNVGISDSDYEIQWYRDNTAIIGANAQNYTIVKEDLGKTLKVTITAKETNESFTGTLTSNVFSAPAIAPEKAMVSASAGNSYVTLNWTKPYANGSDITGYSLTVKQGDTQIEGSPFTIGTDATSYKVEKLTNGTEYNFILSTINGVGSTTSDSVNGKPQSQTNGGNSSSGSSGGGSSSKDDKGDKELPKPPVNQTPPAQGELPLQTTEQNSTNAPVFTDTENHWAKSDIDFVIQRGLFGGTGDGEFSPNMPMTRGMFVTVLGKLAKADLTGFNSTDFKDVKSDAYYLPYIQWANTSGIVNGISSEEFAPDMEISREQMAVMLLNYIKAMNIDLAKLNEENQFSDTDEMSTWAKEAVKAIQMSGILSGKPDNKFDPKGIATRAEVSSMLRKLIELTEQG